MYWSYALSKPELTGDLTLAAIMQFRRRHPDTNGHIEIHTRPGVTRPELPGVAWGDNEHVPAGYLYFVLEDDEA
jgi:hypothetical protein